ncbi:hypothetical protein Vadar_030489 [Vaccinium darrowii]|nr:hypothetical protein Vadar_030489 [Vaccinium darrowii]
MCGRSKLGQAINGCPPCPTRLGMMVVMKHLNRHREVRSMLFVRDALVSPHGEHAWLYGLRRSSLLADDSCIVLALLIRQWAWAVLASRKECYLVDPASSHMLVSKIKPCMCKRTTAKAFAKDVFINQERKLGVRRRSDTILVSTINDADQGSADVTFRTPLAPYEKSKFLGSGGSMVARLKLKGIDGRAPPGVEPAA